MPLACDRNGRQTVAMIISSASSNAQFAQIYWTKYLQPRRKAFAIVLERAKARNEIPTDLDFFVLPFLTVRLLNRICRKEQNLDRFIVHNGRFAYYTFAEIDSAIKLDFCCTS